MEERWRRWALAACCCWIWIVQAMKISEEEFSEELILRPLRDGNVLSHFHFVTRLPPVESYGAHHHIFPKAIFQLVQKYKIREMELSFTQGRWNYERWGAVDALAQSAAKPVGVELSASFDLPREQVDATWGNLTHALSGLFCASINFLESSTTYLEPWFSFRPNPNHTIDELGKKKVVRGKAYTTGQTRYGALPREAVCTENLTPWLKLLPCRDKAGLTTLLDRATIYSGSYHSLRLIITSSKGQDTLLEQTLTFVSRRSASPSPNKNTDWTISSLFGSGLVGKCPLAKVSNVYLQLEDNGQVVNYKDNPVFSLTEAPDRTLRGTSSVLYEYKVSKGRELDIGGSWNIPSIGWPASRGQFYISRFLTGSGNMRGSMVLHLHRTSTQEEQDILVLQMIPWYIRLYGHTLQVKYDGQRVDFWDAVKMMRFTPGEDRKSPTVMEIYLRVPAQTQIISITVDYDKGFLHIDEHPPDANRGFDVPSAIVTFPAYHVSEHFDTADVSSLLSSFQEERAMQMYTEVLLMPLATPDFSMPYNVITLTCTVLAVYFGSLLNTMIRRLGEEQQQTKGGKDERLLAKLLKRVGVQNDKNISLLIKAIVIGIIFFAANHYTSS